MIDVQTGPDGWLDLFADVVSRVSYKPGWDIRLEFKRFDEHLGGGTGPTLIVETFQPDSRDVTRLAGLTHFFVVPPAAWNRETWERWIFDQVAQVEVHECMEFFKVDGWAPFFPPHGFQNGHNPYTVVRRERVAA